MLTLRPSCDSSYSLVFILPTPFLPMLEVQDGGPYKGVSRGASGKGLAQEAEETVDPDSESLHLIHHAPKC